MGKLRQSLPIVLQRSFLCWGPMSSELSIMLLLLKFPIQPNGIGLIEETKVTVWNAEASMRHGYLERTQRWNCSSVHLLGYFKCLSLMWSHLSQTDMKRQIMWQKAQKQRLKNHHLSQVRMLRRRFYLKLCALENKIYLTNSVFILHKHNPSYEITKEALLSNKIKIDILIKKLKKID